MIHKFLLKRYRDSLFIQILIMNLQTLMDSNILFLFYTCLLKYLLLFNLLIIGYQLLPI
jgi:hypothetical protein